MPAIADRVRTIAARLLICVAAACSSAPQPSDASASGGAPAPAPLPGDTSMQVERPSDLEIVLTRTFAAPRTEVFAAMTEPAQLRQWMETAGMSLVACEVDLRVDGTLRYGYQHGPRRTIEVRGVFEEVKPPQTVAYLESYDFSPLRVRVRSTFEEAQGRTRFRQVLTYATKRERDEDFAGVTSSSREAYERLDRHLARAAK